MTTTTATARERAFAAGAIALAVVVVAGDFSLWRVFGAEHRDAHVQIDSEQRLIEEAARVVLVDELSRRLTSAQPRENAIANDPVADDLGLVLVNDDGHQILPRALEPAAQRESRPHDFYEKLSSGDDLKRFGAIFELYQRMVAVRMASRESPAVFAKAVRAFLEHRANVKTAYDGDVVVSLYVVDALLDRGDADPAFLRELLRDGVDVGSARVESVQDQLLRARLWMADADAARLRGEFLRRCARAGVDTAAFDAEWAALEVAPLQIPARAHRGPTLLPGYVYLEPIEGSRSAVHGIRFAAADALAFVDADLRKRRLLEDGESIVVAAVDDASLVTATLHAPRLESARAAADARLLWKQVLLAVTTLLAAGVVAAALLEVARRRRFDALRAGFVAAVSHELRTPLASMRLLVESMSMSARGDDKNREKLARLGRDVDGLEFLVENILSFSRLERGRLVPKKERTSLVEVVADVVERSRSDTDAVFVVEAGDAGDDAGTVRADPELVGIVVSNLVRNAWQHNPRPDRRVRVLVVDDGGGGGARVRVEDNGPGVPAVDRERVFVEFERGSRAASRGTGLGLALCRQIARAHGGDVTLASTGPHGSAFELTLPDGR